MKKITVVVPVLCSRLGHMYMIENTETKHDRVMVSAVPVSENSKRLHKLFSDLIGAKNLSSLSSHSGTQISRRIPYKTWLEMKSLYSG